MWCKHMERKIIYFGGIDRVLRFVQKTSNMPAAMRLISGTNIVDAKSLLGVFSLDLTKPVTLEVRGDTKNLQEVWDAIDDYIRE